MALAIRVAGEEEGEGGRAMGMVIKVVGEWTATAMKRVTVTKMKEVGKEEGNGKGVKSNGNGKDGGDGKQQQ